LPLTGSRELAVRFARLSSAERRLVLRMLGWRLILPLLKRAVPIQRLARLMAGTRRSEVARSVLPSRIVSLAQVVCRLPVLGTRDNCLERSLIAYRYLRMGGADAELAVGFGSQEGRLSGHAWVTVAGTPVEEPPPDPAFGRVLTFAGDGSVVGNRA
jgi:hypothetical protein